ncbi:MAG: hypothetical protein WBL07_05560, partial [Thiothrix litoralis]|uniref:hypothetical protein n=1 Tax=Thiothrix litoralis TaxID=2891210 RepID=UPI003C72C6B0
TWVEGQPADVSVTQAKLAGDHFTHRVSPAKFGGWMPYFALFCPILPYFGRFCSFLACFREILGQGKRA